jgi:hypothetical protein
MYSLNHCQVKDIKMHPTSQILVPFAADGSCFNPSLRCPRTGTYTVGEEGKEITFETFDSALEHIKMMYTPRWRRPNEAGDWEIVAAVIWEVMPKKYQTCY